MSKTQITKIYDKIFKKILTLSSVSVINLINGLFETEYSLDSKVTYNWTEFQDETLRTVLADTIVTINEKDAYHLEAMMYEDSSIVLRVFDYGYLHATRQVRQDGKREKLIFPKPIIIYLSDQAPKEDVFHLEIEFADQGSFDYQVPIVRFQEITTEELNRRKMVILIPFKLLKLRKRLKEERSKTNLDDLKNLIENDIIGSINKNLEMGNITREDAYRLGNLCHLLYRHLYEHLEGMEEVSDMTDESLIFDIDIIEKQVEELQAELERKDEELEQKDAEMKQKDVELEQKDAEMKQKDVELEQKDAEMKQKDAELEQKNVEIEELKRLLAEKNR